MRIPELNPIPRQRSALDVFRGYNHNLRIQSGEFYHMENLTSDRYPVLSPRKSRGLYAAPASPQGIIAKEKVCYVDGADFVIGTDRYPMGLSVNPWDCPKQLTSMGAYVIILPDKCYINTADPSDRGSLDAVVHTSGEVKFSLCREDGTDLSPEFTQNDAPENPENGAIWLDTSTNSLKQWSAAANSWVSLASTFIRISANRIGVPFAKYDGVEVHGIADTLPALEGANVIRERGEDFIVVTGILTEPLTTTDSITIERRCPELDFLVECGNRLWGCRYGEDRNGETVNRIYASKLGDFKNWNCFMGVSTDSYFVNLGSDGPFTGAVAYMGSPVFFKENMMHRIYGAIPAAFGLQDTPCRGVQPGCHRSLAIVGEVLYYKSRSGICACDGSLPWEVGEALGDIRYRNAVAGSVGSKYYISMESDDGWSLFVYDTARGLWHREDSLHCGGFAALGGELYAIDDRSRNILALLGSGEPGEDEVVWLAETGELGLGSPDMKYISRITLRLSMPPGAVLDLYAQYDRSDAWEYLCTIRTTRLRSFAVPVRPRRCDQLRLQLRGTGDIRLYSMVKTIEEGSDIS